MTFGFDFPSVHGALWVEEEGKRLIIGSSPLSHQRAVLPNERSCNDWLHYQLPSKSGHNCSGI